MPDRKPDPPAPVRRFGHGTGEWIARLLGEGRGGTGSIAPARLVAVRFYRADAPDRAVREALIPSGRFEALYEEEWREIFERAHVIENADGNGAQPRSRD